VNRRLLYIAAGAGAILFVAVYTYMLAGIYDRADAGGEPVMFAVARGEAFSSVKQRLHEDDLIDHPNALAIYVLFKRYDRQIKVGTYRFDRGDRAKNILGALVRGDVYKVAVTVPEGLISHEIARILSREARIDSVAFMNVLSDEGTLQGLGVDAPSLEGYLFPDTYWVPWAAPAQDVAWVMVRRFQDIFDAEAEARAQAIDMTIHEVVTMASIVQAEARLEEEMERIAAVYYNRLRIGMRLEADPTVAFAMGGYRGRLFYRDLEIDSPYNTYRNSGLPPGPICSPGSEALHAALYPDSTCDAIYFVAEGNGGHIFSRTLSEHLDAVNKARRARSAQNNR
jgi:UPF0755 protein